MGTTEIQIKSKHLTKAYDEALGFLSVHKYEMKQAIKPAKIICKRPRHFGRDSNIKIGFWNKPDEGIASVAIEWNRKAKNDALVIADTLLSKYAK